MKSWSDNPSPIHWSITLVIDWMHVTVLVDVLRALGTESAVVADWGCWVIHVYVSGNAANRTAMGAAGACEGECVSCTVL